MGVNDKNILGLTELTLLADADWIPVWDADEAAVIKTKKISHENIFNLQKAAAAALDVNFENTNASAQAVNLQLKNNADYFKFALAVDGSLQGYLGANNVFGVGAGATKKGFALTNTAWILNPNRVDLDFTIRKLTSGDAYVYDAGADTHTFSGTVSGISAAMVGLGNVDNIADANQVSIGQITDQDLSVIRADANPVNIALGNTAKTNYFRTTASGDFQFLIGAYEMIEIAAASTNKLLLADNAELILNPNQADLDFTIRKNASGDAYIYNAGADSHTFSGAISMDKAPQIDDAGAATTELLIKNSEATPQIVNFKLENGAGNYFRFQLYTGGGGAFELDGIDVIGLSSGITVKPIQINPSGINFNPTNGDYNFVVEKLTSGNAIQYIASSGILNFDVNNFNIGGATVRMDNNKAIQMRDSGGTARGVFILNSSDQLLIGATAAGISTRIRGGDGTAEVDLSDTAATFNLNREDVDFYIRKLTANNAYVYNAGNDNHLYSGAVIFNNDAGDFDFTVNKATSGQAIVYDAGADTLTLDAANGITLTGDVQTLVMPNNTWMQFKDSGGTARDVMTITSGDVFFIGGSAGVSATRIRGGDGSPEFAVQTNGIIVNLNQEDCDFTIRKNTSGDALIYDAGADTFALDGASLTLADAMNIILNTTTGSKIGTAASQKLGFFGATPVIQANHIADPTGGTTTDAEARTAINAILVVLENLGLTAAA